MKNKYKFEINEIINNPQLLLNKFLCRRYIKNNSYLFIYYFYKIDNESLYIRRTEYYKNNPNISYYFIKIKIENMIKWFGNYNFNELF